MTETVEKAAFGALRTKAIYASFSREEEQAFLDAEEELYGAPNQQWRKRFWNQK